MTTNSNGSYVGTPLFKYARPTFNGFGFADEPDPKVSKAIDELVDLLEKGFYDKTSQNDTELNKFKVTLARLEDETMNGINSANRKLRYQVEEVKNAQVKLNLEESIVQKAVDAVKKAQDLLQELLLKVSRSQDKLGNEEKQKRDHTDTTNKSGGDMRDEIEKARKVLREREEEKLKADNDLLLAVNELDNKKAAQEYAMLEKLQLKEEVDANLQETLRKINDFEKKMKEDNKYGEIFSLERLDDKIAGKIKFKNKIGSNHQLNSLFIVLEDKIEKSRLSFNSSIFFKHEVVLEFIFLRIYFIDGLRDAQAIFERVTNEEEGGVKYLYDFILKKVVEQIIKAKKLIQ